MAKAKRPQEIKVRVKHMGHCLQPHLSQQRSKLKIHFFSHYFVISCTFYINTDHLRCLGTFSYDSFRAVHQISDCDELINTTFNGQWIHQ